MIMTDQDHVWLIFFHLLASQNWFKFTPQSCGLNTSVLQSAKFDMWNHSYINLVKNVWCGEVRFRYKSRLSAHVVQSWKSLS